MRGPSGSSAPSNSEKCGEKAVFCRVPEGRNTAWNSARRKIFSGIGTSGVGDVDLGQHRTAPLIKRRRARTSADALVNQGVPDQPFRLIDAPTPDKREALPCAVLCSPPSPPLWSLPPSLRSRPPKRRATASEAATGAIQAIASTRPSASAGRPLPVPMPIAGAIRVTLSRANGTTNTERIARRISSTTLSAFSVPIESERADIRLRLDDDRKNAPAIGLPAGTANPPKRHST